jgi:NTE family protein
MIKNFNKKSFSLVLSGGGALGIAHLGVVHDLEQYNVVPSEIIGTSMGSRSLSGYWDERERNFYSF